MADWRVAASLLTLRDQVNAAWPNRNRASDGTIGDARHRSRSSDHNPWIRDGSVDVVSALDITHDPASGCDAARIAASIRQSQDKRVKYIIWNRRICNSSPLEGQPAWNWRPYRGANPHDKHVHISVKSAKSHYDDTSAWQLGASAVPVIADPVGPEASSRPTLRRRSRGAAVEELQKLLRRHEFRIRVDGGFGAATEQAVKDFQERSRLVADGVVGAKTWAALLH